MKKIFLLKTNESVKQKAYDKLKEISNKSNDNSSKAVQYLDNLLKIPFGIYQKEEILTRYNKFVLDYVTILKKDLSNLNDTTKTKYFDYIKFLENLTQKNDIYYDEVIKSNEFLKIIFSNTVDSELLSKNILKYKKMIYL